jgi:cyclase
MTFNDSLYIHGSKRSVMLREVENGHTKSDLMMILPVEGIVFMGDLLFEKRHPYLPQGKPDALLAIMENLSANNTLKIFVPGHGEPGSRNVLEEQAKYITELRRLISASVSAGEADSVIRKLKIPEEYADWKFGRFFPANVNFLLKEAKASGGLGNRN